MSCRNGVTLLSLSLFVSKDVDGQICLVHLSQPSHGAGSHTLWGWLSLCYLNGVKIKKMEAMLQINLKSLIQLKCNNLTHPPHRKNIHRKNPSYKCIS